MKIQIALSMFLVGALMFGCQRETGPAASAKNSGQFDPHDLSGMWAAFGT